MKLLIIITALNLPVLASGRPIHVDKRLMQQLVRQTPWDRTRLAHMLKLDLWEEVAADDYVPEAAKLLAQLVRTVAQEEKLVKMLLWQVTAPRGQQYWLLGIHHFTRLGFFSAAGRQQLDTLIAEIDVFMPEGDALLDTSWPLAQYPKLDQQLTVMAQRHGKKVVPLEDAFAMLRATTFVENISLWQESQAESFTAAEIEAYLLSTVTEWERLLREQQAYLRGDLTALLALQQQDPHKNSDWNAYLIGERNRNWLPKIIQACHRDATCLIATGYSHFTLDSEAVTSVITMLREHGYRVEPM